MIRAHYYLYRFSFLRPKTLPGVTISIGNITAGGTGKSPLIIEFAQALKKAGYRPAILSRGYKSGLSRKSILVYQNGLSIYRYKIKNKSSIHADEALMQSVKLSEVPIITARRRYEAALYYLKNQIQTQHWLLDDGYQHYTTRDFNIVCLDAQTPFSNGFFLPLGALRSPFSDLNRADLICYTRANSKYPSLEDKNIVGFYTKAQSLDLNFKSLWPVEAKSFFQLHLKV